MAAPEYFLVRQRQNPTPIEASMTLSEIRRKAALHSWITRFVLVLLLGLHSAGLFHHHATASEQIDCVACQVTDHQALDVPDAGAAAPLALLVLLFFVSPWYPPAVRFTRQFSRALSRAPPLSLNP